MLWMYRTDIEGKHLITVVVNEPVTLFRKQAGQLCVYIW